MQWVEEPLPESLSAPAPRGEDGSGEGRSGGRGVHEAERKRSGPGTEKHRPHQFSAGATETSEVSDSLSFEGALGELEATVERLEAGEMPLEEALTLFERGVNLSRQCSSTLESAERRIGILVAGREGELAEPFEMDGLDEDEDEDDDEFED